MQGLTYIPNYITEQEECDITNLINEHVWNTELTRRTQHYGYTYPYDTKNILLPTTPIPEEITYLVDKLSEEYAVQFDQLIVNEYEPGQGISAHIDHAKLFDDTIISISMGSSCVMKFEQVGTANIYEIVLEPKSLLVLQNDARYKWKHSIPARKKDNNIPRSKRISLTFRKKK